MVDDFDWKAQNVQVSESLIRVARSNLGGGSNPGLVETGFECASFWINAPKSVTKYDA